MPLALFSLIVAGCSSSAPSAAGGTADAEADAMPVCLPYSADAALATIPSFRADVAPIFQQNCTTNGANCHGDPASSPYLGGADGGPADPAAVLASIVGVAAAEDPAMDLVTPGDPARSYLVHKIDHDQCTMAADCAKTLVNGKAYYPTCGEGMPFGMAQLPPAVRDVVRAWIQQGSADN